MVLVSTGSIFLAMTSPIYVWIGSALFHFLCFLFFDIEGDSPIIAVGKSTTVDPRYSEIIIREKKKMNKAKDFQMLVSAIFFLLLQFIQIMI